MIDRRKDFLSFSPPSIGEEEIAQVVDTLRNGWITTGPKTHAFEKSFASSVRAPGALALSSCTAGLHMALVAGGIGHGDEVITTPLTFCATVNVIEHVGAVPVLADVEPETLNIDPAQVQAKITPRTKAIILVHYAGHPVDLDAFHALARIHDLLLIEDAAHALPASYKGVPIGSGGNPVSFSFYATKNLTTGEGGMLTGSEDLLERARVLSLHGMSRDAWRRYAKAGSWRYAVEVPGFKYNMSDIQAALGLEQLKKLDRFQSRRREIVAQYIDAFGAFDGLELPIERPEVDHAWHLFVLRIRNGALKITRDEVIEALKDRNIGTSVHFIPIHIHPYYAEKYQYKPTDFPVTIDNAERMISLPLNPSMTDQDVRDVIDAVSDVVRQYGS
ncbi:MAG: DegT/DnrJ/EryC1/StrS family aminotransferase [Geminicoccaceae bacterium]